MRVSRAVREALTMVLASSSGRERGRQGRRCCRRARRARRREQPSKPPPLLTPREPLGLHANPPLHAQSCNQKRVGHPATAAIGSRPGGFKKNGTAAHSHPPPCDPQAEDRPNLYHHHPSGPGKRGQPLWAHGCHSQARVSPYLSRRRGGLGGVRVHMQGGAGRWARWDARFSTEL